MRPPDWQSPCGKVALYCADCRDILPGLASESVDMIWTDPPYGNNNNNNGDLISRREAALGVGDYIPGESDRPIQNDGPIEARAVIDAMLRDATRILRRPCCCCCCAGGGGPDPLFAWFAQRMDTEGLSFFQAVVWDKGGLGMGWRYRRNYEMIMVAHRKGGRLKWECSDKGKITGNVVRIGRIIPSASEHPTPKPVELIEHFLRLHTIQDDMVLDPFMGAGPTGVAAVKLGRRFVGVEIERRYFDIARDRIEVALAEAAADMFGPLPDVPEQPDLTFETKTKGDDEHGNG